MRYLSCIASVFVGFFIALRTAAAIVCTRVNPNCEACSDAKNMLTAGDNTVERARVWWLPCLASLMAWFLLVSVAVADGPQVYVQLGHSQRVLSVAFSPDNRLLASCSADGTIKFWDLSSGRELRTLAGHLAVVTSVTFSPDGTLLASGGLDRTVKVWEVSSGRLVRTLSGHSQAVFSVAFAPDGHTLASGSDDGSVKLWQVTSGRVLLTLGGHLAIASVAFSPDGGTLAAGGVDHNIKLWNVASGRLVRTLSGHTQAVFSVAFSPDGHTLASGSQDRSVRTWDVESGRELHALTGHTQGVSSVAFSADGHALVSGSQDRSIRIWDAATGQQLRTVQALPASVYCVAFAPSEMTLGVGIGDGSIRLLAVADGRPLQTLSGHSNLVRAIAFSPDGSLLASAGASRSVALWDIASGQQLHTLSGHSDTILALAFAPDGRMLASASHDGIRLWNVAGASQVRTLAGQDNWVYSVSFAPDGRTLASGGQDRTIRIWEVATGREVRMLSGHSDAVYAVAFSPDGRTLASGSADFNIKLWDVATGRELRTLRGHSHFVSSIAFSPDGRNLISGSTDNSVKLWSVDSGMELRNFAGQFGVVLSAAYSPDGRTVASAGADRDIHLWDPATGQQLRVLHGHTGAVWSVAFSHDGHMLASGSADHTVKLWSAADGREQLSDIAFDDGSVVSITPEGFYDYQRATAEQNLLVRTGTRLFEITDIAAFREKFYRPDLVRQSLGAQGLPANLATISTVRPAPEVSLVNVPGTIDSASLHLQIALTDRGGGIGKVRVDINGTAVSQSDNRGLEITAAHGTVSKLLELQLVPGVNRVSVVAYNGDGSMLSEPATASVLATYQPTRRLQLDALVVGIERFRNSALDLRYSVSDATAVAHMLQKKAAPLFGQVNVELRVSPESTTREALLSAIAAYRGIAPEDVFLFYVASHGTVDESDAARREYYLIPSNVGLTSTEALRRDAISQDELKQLVANIPATKKVLLLDTCQAGALGEALSLTPRGIDEQRAVNILSQAIGATILSAATNHEQALEGKDGHGVFTWVVLQGLDGKADLQRNGYVSTLDLAEFVADQVPKVAQQVFRREQFPVLNNTGQPFPIVSSR
jgi:WD40 repeat protein